MTTTVAARAMQAHVAASATHFLCQVNTSLRNWMMGSIDDFSNWSNCSIASTMVLTSLVGSSHVWYCFIAGRRRTRHASTPTGTGVPRGVNIAVGRVLRAAGPVEELDGVAGEATSSSYTTKTRPPSRFSVTMETVARRRSSTMTLSPAVNPVSTCEAKVMVSACFLSKIFSSSIETVGTPSRKQAAAKIRSLAMSVTEPWRSFSTRRLM
mmetsp:Transcript_88720/g.255882  ORF Transcript_88720/g.255882 Transcript_88720/m.255882 type:complete len:210 (+) Transcript_88720:618-1247(+)